MWLKIRKIFYFSNFRIDQQSYVDYMNILKARNVAATQTNLNEAQDNNVPNIDNNTGNLDTKRTENETT